MNVNREPVEPSLACHSEALSNLLNQKGFRITDQRQKIIRTLQDMPEGSHLSAEEIYRQLLEQGENVGISTVYRALHLMVDLGYLRELGLSESKRYYELSQPSGQHHHLVCIECGKVQEFEEDLIAKIGMEEAESRGFSLLDCRLSVLAVCRDCQLG